jgi:molybdenum cofactor cytidylyltransferase
MKFGPVPVQDAIGAVTAHGIKAAEVTVRKGSVLTAEDVGRLEAAGIRSVVAVRLEAGDVPEDEAARRLAEALTGEGLRVDRPFTGRCNLFATHAGVLRIARDVVDGINALDEAVTVATLPEFKPVVAGEMVATVKIIPYAAPASALDAAIALARREALSVASYRVGKVGVVSTLLPGLKPSVVDKTLGVLAERIAPAGTSIVADRRIAHRTADLAEALRQLARSDAGLLVVFGASAIADRRDVIPAALEAAGGRIEHFGMPVDPGNLLLVGSLGGKPVVGAPGCARSPKENGFDWVLHRLLAGLPVRRTDIVGMGVGGLLMEIISRPQPRQGGESAGDGP